MKCRRTGWHKSYTFGITDVRLKCGRTEVEGAVAVRSEAGVIPITAGKGDEFHISRTGEPLWHEGHRSNG